jgi:hypothetical protein
LSTTGEGRTLRLMEEQPRWLTILRVLEEHGAMRVPGFRCPQEELSALCEIPGRQLRSYLKAMETYGILVVRRGSIDGTWGAPRTHNLYLLKCTAKRWADELGPALAADRQQKLENRRRAILANKRSEKERHERTARPRKETPSAPSPVVLEAPEIEQLARSYASESAAELEGW